MIKKNHIKALQIVLPLLFLGILSLYFLTQNNLDPNVTKKFEIGSTFPVLEGKDLAGLDFISTDFKNQIVIVNFWASWCAPCIEEIPSLIKLVNDFKGQVQLIAISADDSLEEIETFKKSFPGLNHKNITLVWDKDRNYMKKFNIFKLPESFVLTKNGLIVKKVSGTINWFNENSISYFKDLLTEK